MKKQVIYLELEPKLKEKIRKIADAERRSLTSFMLLLIDKKINEVENAKTN